MEERKGWTVNGEMIKNKIPKGLTGVTQVVKFPLPISGPCVFGGARPPCLSQ